MGHAHALPADVRSPHTPPLPPGPAWPPLVPVMRMALRPFEMLDDGARRYGDAFTLRGVDGRAAVVVSHPDAVRDVWAGDGDAMHGGEAAGEMLSPILGENALLVLDGARHRRE